MKAPYRLRNNAKRTEGMAYWFTSWPCVTRGRCTLLGLLRGSHSASLTTLSPCALRASSVPRTRFASGTSRSRDWRARARGAHLHFEGESVPGGRAGHRGVPCRRPRMVRARRAGRG
jgi:hypothetical protein